MLLIVNDKIMWVHDKKLSRMLLFISLAIMVTLFAIVLDSSQRLVVDICDV